MFEQVEHGDRSSSSGYPQCRQRTPHARSPLPSLGTLVARMSHDLRTPLAAILANAEFLAHSNLNEEERDELYEEIRFSVDRMNELVSDLLECSKGGRGPSPGDWQYCRDDGARDENDRRTAGIPAHHHHASPRRIGHRLVQLQTPGTSDVECCPECLRGGFP